MYCFYVLFRFLIVAVALHNAIAAMKCNGMEDLCDLTINQVTFPGSHNAGSDGTETYCLDCYARNQDKSFSEQLAFGIRYFDIDTCYKGSKAVNCHCDGLCCYTSSIEKSLLEIDGWMKSNRNEIVIIHFNRDYQPDTVENIAKSLENVLLKLWSPNNVNAVKLAMNNFYMKNGKWRWPTLKEAITSNQRIFIFMDEKLVEKFSIWRDWVTKSNKLITSSWGPDSDDDCSHIVKYAKSKCWGRGQFMSLAAFGHPGFSIMCIDSYAEGCSKLLGEAQQACYQRRKMKGKTVNFLLVDYVDIYSGKESVVNNAELLNHKNVNDYVRNNYGCSYNAGWFGSYCWKYCGPPKSQSAEKDWCWINQSCGDNEKVCKHKYYSCYSECGN